MLPDPKFHIVVGAAAAAIGNGNAISGAAGAGARELASGATKNKDKTTQQIVSTLIGAAAGKGTGASIALKGEKFNRQLHEDEIKWIKQHSLEFAKKNNLDPKTAQALLTLGALGMVDAKENAYIQQAIHSGILTQEQVANAQNYIKGHVVKEKATFQDEHRHYGDMLVTPESKTQMMFTVSKEQYFDNSYDPNENLGGNAQPNTLDVLSLIPSVRAGENALKESVKAVDKSLSKGVDDALDVKINPLDGTESKGNLLNEGPNGGKVNLTKYNTEDGKPIYQRESGEYFTYDENGKQVRVNSPTEHGNTLNDTQAELYQLVDRETGEVKKYGETIHGESRYGAGNQKRYSKDYLKKHNVQYEQIETGTKKEMHKKQHELIQEHKAKNNGKRPELNKNDY